MLSAAKGGHKEIIDWMMKLYLSEKKEEEEVDTKSIYEDILKAAINGNQVNIVRMIGELNVLKSYPWQIGKLYITNRIFDIDTLINREEIIDLLIYSAEAGYIDYIEEILDRKLKDIYKESFEDTMLSAAKGTGNLDIINLMLALGAKNYKKTMEAASEKGHIKIVELMLSLRAKNYGKCMIAASKGGHKDIVLMILEAANYDKLHNRWIKNLQLSDYLGSIFPSSKGGYEEILYLMLEIIETKKNEDTSKLPLRYRRNVENTSLLSYSYIIAMSAAAEGGHIKIVKDMLNLLRKEKIFEKTEARKYFSAVYNASLGGHIEILRFLLDQPEAKYTPPRSYEISLKHSVEKGYNKIVELLLTIISKRKDKNEMLELYNEMLLLATDRGQKDTMKLLQLLIDELSQEKLEKQ